MPRNPTSDVEHVVFTDHSIPRRGAAPAASPSPTADLVPFDGGEASPRDLGLAYAILGVRDGNTAYLDRAFRLLRQVAAQGGADSETLAYLAQFYRDGKDDTHALPLYQEAWRKDSTQYAAAAALGAYQMQRGNLEEAIRLWNDALAISPGLVLVRTNLAIALLRIGHADQARETLEKALEFNPSSKEARDLLSRIPK
jgi:tetratricopeptide (TPR) repeat protein